MIKNTFLSKMLKGSVAAKQHTRAMSTAISQVVHESAEADAKRLADENAGIKTLWQVHAEKQAAQNQKVAAEAEYAQYLKESSTVEGVFRKLEHVEGDHPHLNAVRAKINKIVEQELEFLRFKDQVSSEEQTGIAAATYDEVTTKKNFYFSIDENKVNTNLKVVNMKAPGNNKRHPQVILPHECVNISKFMQTEGLSKEKLFEIYAYYSFMVDMHISQIRPDNLDEVSYVPAHFNTSEHTWDMGQNLENMFFDYYHRWREPTRTWFSQTQEINFKEDLSNRPIADHYDHSKGSKFDVDWTEDMKFPHVATRTGYPILEEAPIERIFGLERAPAHPGYQFQPFVQTPSMNPDENLDFSLGETIYENRGVVEWTRFWKTSILATFGFAPGFYVFEIYAADGVPSLQWLADKWGWWSIPRQFQDGSNWGVEELRYCDDHDLMNMQYGGKRSFARPAHTMYVFQLYWLLKYANFQYVSKMVYNKDKDIVFVYKPTGFWNEQEYVYEMHHLEQVIPYSVTARKNMSSQREDGILTIGCMNTKDHMKFYNEKKYWNLDERDDFMHQTSNLWRNATDKYQGSIFHVVSKADEEEALMQMKVDREMQAAIAKHGEATPSKPHEEIFYETIEKKKRDIVGV